jgi:hypothetical protein
VPSVQRVPEPAAPHDNEDHSHLACEDGESEIEEVELFLAAKSERDVAPGAKESAKRALDGGNPFRPRWVSAVTKERARIGSYY